MKLQKRMMLSLVVLLLSAIAASAANISSDYDHNTNFAKYKTYSWGKVKTADSLWDERVKDAVNRELGAKGWTLVPSGGEVTVTARDAIHNQEQLNTFYDQFGGFGGRRWGGGIGTGMATTTVDTYKVGTLVVDMFDAGSKNLIWRSAASDTLSNNSDKNIKNLDKNVHKMFQHFPPDSHHG